MRVPQAAGLLAIALAVAVFVLKPIGAPYAIAVSTTSPTSGSLLVLEKAEPGTVHLDDCVLYCWDRMRTSCILARVATGGQYYLVGDPLAPNAERVTITGGTIYRVIGTIPASAWLPLLAVVAIPLYYIARRASPATALLLAIILLDVAAIGGAYVENARPKANAPVLELEKTFFDPHAKTLTVTLYSPTLLPRSATCMLEDGETVRPGIKPLGGGRYRLLVPITLRDLEYLYAGKKVEVETLPSPPAKVYQAVKAECTVNLSIGALKGEYSAGFHWSDLMLFPVTGGLRVFNPNPLPFNATIIILDAGGSVLVREKVAIPPGSYLHVNLPEGGQPPYTVRVYYRLLGVKRSLQIVLKS